MGQLSLACVGLVQQLSQPRVDRTLRAVPACRSPRLRVLVGLGAGLGMVALALLVARADAAPMPIITTEGNCPSRDQLVTALTSLLRTATPTAPTDTPGLLLAVDDLGPRYRVSLEGEPQEHLVREYVDEDRDCPERARIAALFVAVTIEPPEVAARQKPVSPTPAPRHFELRLAADGELGWQARTPGALGGEVRGALLGRRFGIEVGAAALSPAHLQWGAYQATLTRFPFDVSVRVTAQAVHVAAGLSAGLAASIFTLQGDGTSLAAHANGTRLDLGARAATFVALFPGARLSPFLDVHASLWPRPYAVIVDGVGEVGKMPGLWVGATLGAAVRLP